jgi:hypothetical protein
MYVKHSVLRCGGVDSPKMKIKSSSNKPEGDGLPW